MSGPREILLVRFLAKVAPHPYGCWDWTGSRQKNGYGRLGIGSRGQGVRVAHRVAWEIFHGAVPPGMKVCHRCDRPSCVNPVHLFLGTQADNLADMRAKGRQARGRKVPQAKLHPEDVLTIREGDACGLSAKSLAGIYGVSASAIRHILKGHTWKHIGGSK